MAKKLKTSLIVILATILLAVSICFVFSMQNKSNFVYADKTTISSEIVNDYYSLGQEVDFPKEIKIQDGAEEYTATDGVVCFPDKAAKHVGYTRLNQLGQYSIRYFYTKDDKLCVAEKNFEVSNQLYNLSTNNGSITPVLASAQNNGEFIDNSSNITFAKEDALIVRASEGNTFSYTKSIDLADVGADGLANIITLDYKLTNTKKNTEGVLVGYNPSTGAGRYLVEYLPVQDSARYCYIRLTDSYDSSNYIELCYYISGDANLDYKDYFSTSYYFTFTARAKGQIRTGLSDYVEGGENNYATVKKVEIDGTPYLCDMNNSNGRKIRSSVMNNHEPFTWKYDYENNRVYVSVPNEEDEYSDYIVSALSSSEIYGTEVFKGFSTSKVKLSIYMDTFVSDAESRLDIHSIGKDSGKKLVESYGKTGFFDDVALPNIDHGVVPTENEFIYAPIDSTFSVPVLTAKDNTEFTYSVNAYFNYGTQNQMDVPIIANTLLINKNVDYTIKYSIFCDNGAKIDKFIKIRPKSNSEAITLSANYDNLSLINAGDTITLPEHSLTTINDATKLKLNIKAIHESETIDVSTDARTFVPHYAGQYKIVYTYSDNVYSLMKEFSVQCQSSDRVGFMDKLELPRYFIKDKEYSIPRIKAFSYAGANPEEIEAKAYVAYDGGEYSSVPIDLSQIKITGNEKVKFKAECSKGAQSAMIESDYIKIVDIKASDNKFFHGNFFVYQNADISNNPQLDYDMDFSVKVLENEKRVTDIRYDSNIMSGKNRIQYVNAINFTNFKTEFIIPKDLGNYEKVNFILTDFNDATKKYVISFMNVDGLCYASLNGGINYKTEQAFSHNGLKTVIYDYEKNSMTLNDLIVPNVNLLSYFSSPFCYLDIELEGIDGQSSLTIKSLNYEAFNGKKIKDESYPVIFYDDFSGNYNLDEIVTISIPYVSDLFTPILDKNISLTVMKDGAVITSVDGIMLDQTCDPFRTYQVKVSDFGTYTATYSAKDDANTIMTQCRFSVVDTTIPTIQFEKEYVGTQKLKVNDVFDFSVIVSDDSTASEEIKTYAFVKDYESQAFYVCLEDKVKFNYAGMFEVFVYAKDANGNYAFVSVKVEVA